MNAEIKDVSTKIADAKKANNFPAMLEQFKTEIARALPRHLNGDRMARIALTAFRRTPALGKCDPKSVFAAVIQASQLGLEPDTLGRAYLIPYGTECQFVPGWKGLVELANRSQQCTVWTGAVYEGDIFNHALGDRPFINHQPQGEDDPEKLTHVYAVGRIKNSEWPNIEVWPIAKVWKHRDRYNKVGKRHYSFANPEMYARKVLLLQVLKYMPSSPELVMAIGLNDAAEIGEQRLTVAEAIEGSWAPAPAEEVPSDPAAAEGAQAVEAAKATKEKISSKPKITFADIAAKIGGATTLDALDEAAALIDGIPNELQRNELRGMYEAKKLELEDVPQ